MGNHVSTALDCCQPSAPHQEVEMNSMKSPISFPKIEIIRVQDTQDNQTENEPTKIQTKQLESTAGTNFSKQTSSNYHTIMQEMILRMNDLNTTEQAKEIIKIPFSIIKLTLSINLIKLLNHYCEEILGRLQQEATRWQLTTNGNYVSIINDTYVSLFSEKAFYEGQIKANVSDCFVPNKDGLLVTEEGIYKGSFEEGKAHGKGTFIHGQSKTSFKGEWSEGRFVNGVIQNSTFKFIGQMKDGLADGNGKVVFREDGSEYRGTFKQGNYEGENCVLACPHYIYQGSFKAGDKCGKGTVEEKEQKIDLKVGSTRIKKYRPPASLYGEWCYDSLITIIPSAD